MQEWVRTPSRFGVFFSITITRRPGTSESKAAPDHCSVPRTDGKGNVYPRVHAIPSHQLDPVHLDLPAHHLPQSEEPSTGTHRARAPRSMRHLTRMTPNRPAGAATRRRRRADSAAARRRPPVLHDDAPERVTGPASAALRRVRHGRPCSNWNGNGNFLRLFSRRSPVVC